LCPHFKIPVLSFKIQLFIKYLKIDRYFYKHIFSIYEQLFSHLFLYTSLYYILYFIFNKYNFIFFINLITLYYHHLII